jgi:hypothetical protein
MVGVVLIQILTDQTDHSTVKCAHSVLDWTEKDNESTLGIGGRFLFRAHVDTME